MRTRNAPNNGEKKKEQAATKNEVERMSYSANRREPFLLTRTRLEHNVRVRINLNANGGRDEKGGRKRRKRSRRKKENLSTSNDDDGPDDVSQDEEEADPSDAAN